MSKTIKINPVVSVNFDLSRLRVIERMTKKKYIVEVGILGNKNRRSVKTTYSKKTGFRRVRSKEKSSLTNAQIGAIHELGSFSRNIKKRSFLKVPLELKMPGIFVKVGQALINQMNPSNIVQTYKLLGTLAERVVLTAFSTRGYGRWPANSPATIAKKKSEMPLIDSGQLRRSISNRVIKIK